MIICVVILLIIFLTPKTVLGYPNFIGHGYNSCITCHYNPYGNGPLNDYGRALSATAISDRIIYSKDTTEEKIAENSGILYQKPFIKWFRPSVNYRGLELIRSLNRDNKKSEYIHMQANMNVLFRLVGDDRYILSLSYGYAPTPKAQKNEDVGNYRSREHYLGIRPDSTFGVYIGLMDKVFGIRVPDHITFSRAINGLAQNDQTHGVVFHFNKYNIEAGLNPFIGNLSQENDLRQKGMSLKIEYNVSNIIKTGISYLNSKSNHLKKDIKALHSKVGFSKGSSLLFEVGENVEKIVLTKKETKSHYALLQNHLLFKRGLYGSTTIEYFRPNIKRTNETMRFGPGIQYFPFQGFEIRMDLYNTKNFSDEAASKDTWDFAGQVHLWF